MIQANDLLEISEQINRVKGLITCFHLTVNSQELDSYLREEPHYDLYLVIRESIEAINESLLELKQGL